MMRTGFVCTPSLCDEDTVAILTFFFFLTYPSTFLPYQILGMYLDFYLAILLYNHHYNIYVVSIGWLYMFQTQ